MTLFETVEVAFSSTAQSYEGERRLLIPCFDQYYGNAIEIVSDVIGKRPSARILDLGAGTGLLSAMLAHYVPNAAFHLVDISDEMLERARSRFAAEPGRFSFEVADLSTYAPDGPYDSVISALAIHHLSDADKRDLYRRICDWIAPGGVFVNVEQVLGPTPEMELLYDRIWQEQVLGAGGTQTMIDRAKSRMAFDQCATTADQLAWLREAGFAQVDCTFKSWRFAVLTAWK